MINIPFFFHEMCCLTLEFIKCKGSEIVAFPWKPGDSGLTGLISSEVGNILVKYLLHLKFPLKKNAKD